MKSKINEMRRLINQEEYNVLGRGELMESFVSLDNRNFPIVAYFGIAQSSANTTFGLVGILLRKEFFPDRRFWTTTNIPRACHADLSTTTRESNCPHNASKSDNTSLPMSSLSWISLLQVRKIKIVEKIMNGGPEKFTFPINLFSFTRDDHAKKDIKIRNAGSGTEQPWHGTARLPDQTTESMSEELIHAAKGGDVGVVRAILDRGNVDINGEDDRVTIFLFIYLFYLFIRMELLLFIRQAGMVITVW
jgi:hypothetical protein